MNYKLALGGVVVLAATGLVAGTQCTPERAAQSAPQSGNPSIDLPPRSADPRTATLEARIAALESTGDAGSQPASGDTGDASSLSLWTPPDPAAAAAAGVKDHDDLIAKFKAEGVDPSWSPNATQSLKSDFQRLSSTGFRVVSVACHMTICVATLEYPNYSAAQQHVGQLVHHPYAMNCGRGVYTIAPSNPDAVYDGDVILECEGFRAGGR